MKVRVSMPGVYMAMDMEEERARLVFHKLAESLWLMGSRSQKALEDRPAEKAERTEYAAPNYVIEPEPVPELVEDAEVPEIAQKEEADPEPKIISTGYGGYLYMKCHACGKTRGFCAKTRLNNFRCECGAVTKMGNMVPLYIKCECGRQAKYLTNMTDAAFDIPCYDCGAPVAVEWNEKKQRYETIR